MSPKPTLLIFGPSPQAHYVSPQWVLESTAANNLRLRRLAGAGSPAGPYVVFSMIHPTSCTPAGTVPGNAATTQTYRHTFTAGDTLSVNFCTEGSVILVNVMDASSILGLVPPVVQFRCWRHAGNSNMCQRVF